MQAKSSSVRLDGPKKMGKQQTKKRKKRRFFDSWDGVTGFFKERTGGKWAQSLVVKKGKGQEVRHPCRVRIKNRAPKRFIGKGVEDNTNRQETRVYKPKMGGHGLPEGGKGFLDGSVG